MRHNSLLVMLLLYAAAGVLHAAKPVQPDPTVRLRKIYDSSVAKYQNAYKRDAGAWAVSYIQTLKALQEQKQKSGDLDGWSTAKKELDRFLSAPTLTEELVSASTGDLRTTQAQNLERRNNVTAKKHAQILDLKKKYAERLSRIQKEMTRAGNFDIAFRAKNEIERVNGSPEVAAAEAYVASKAEAQRASQQAASDDSAPSRASPAARTAAAPTEVEVLDDGSLLYPPGISPPYDSTTLASH